MNRRIGFLVTAASIAALFTISCVGEPSDSTAENHEDNAASDSALSYTCWGTTYTDLNGGYCYKPCAAGYHGIATVCYETNCKSGYVDTGLTCEPNSYGNGCSNSCPSGYKNIGPCFCRFNGNAYSKGSYDRGAGMPASPVF